MSSWNACCGVSSHAELIGEAFQRQGHELVVYAPMQYVDDNTCRYFTPDQDYVVRNYSFLRYGDRYRDKTLLDSFYLDTEDMMEEDYDLLIVEKPSSIPLGKFREILPRIKSKAKVIAILHEGVLPVNPYFREMDWEEVIVFDDRYKTLFSQVFPDERLHVIPFPCHPLDLRARSKAREKLGLPSDVDMIFSYGRVYKARQVLGALKDLREEYHSILYVYLVGDVLKYRFLKTLEEDYCFLETRFDRPPIEGLNDYLRAADAIIFHRGEANHIAVSSAVHLSLGSLTPIICSDCDYFESFKKGILKYNNSSTLNNHLRDVFQGRTEDVVTQAKRLVGEKLADDIAEQILNV